MKKNPIDFSKIKDAIHKQLPEMEKEAKKIFEEMEGNSPNILSCGKTGVGKSTLINSIFREEIATTGIGEPITKIIKKYKKEGVPVNIYDTPGFEVGDNKEQEEVMNFISKQNSSTNITNHIHIMWYCIAGAGARIEESEINFISEIKKRVDIPIIIVLTKCDQDMDESKKLKEYIHKKNLPVSNIVVTSSSKKINLDVLVLISNEVLPEAFRKAFVNAQIANVELKEKLAYKYLTGYVAGATFSGFSPIPFSSWMLIVPIQLTMLVNISIIFGLDIDKTILTSLTTGTISTSGATFFGRFLASLIKFIPGAGSVIGGIIDGTIAGSITTAMGIGYIKLLAKMVKAKINGDDISDDDLDDFINSEFKNRK